MSIFLDANILFSSSKAGEFQDFFLWLSHHEKLVTSGYALQEAENALTRKRPEWIAGFKTVKKMVTIVPEAVIQDFPLPLRSKDIPIFSSAVSCGADYLVTGDRRDFGDLFGCQYQATMIVNPPELFKIMIEKHGI